MPADCSNPSELTIARITRNDTPTSTSCSAIGTPRRRIPAVSGRSKRSCSLRKVNGSLRRAITSSDRTTLMACANTVASAAPAAPRWKTATSSRSPKIFTTHAMATVMSGILESPSPRKTLPMTLNATMNSVPAEQMRTYCVVGSKASSGACSRRQKGAASVTSKAVSPSATQTNRQMAEPMTLPASSGFPSPIFCPSRTVTPVVRPTSSEVTSCMAWLPVETAEISAVPANLPTTIRSTAPYIACRNSASSTGPAKRSRDGRMLPFRKSFCCFFIPDSKKRAG